MSRVAAGEIDKMGILYERYKIPLYSYFYKSTSGIRETSEDLVHSVFYRAIRYRSSFRGEGSFAKWLFHIAHNVFLDYRRKLRSAAGYEADVRSGTVSDNIEQDNDLKEQLDLLTLAMNKLEDDEREIIVLGKLECLRYKEIASILNTTEGNVRIRIFRTIRKLKDIFEKLENTQYEKEGSKREGNRPS